ncbi:hypothetical protein Ancab_013557 [Ancistrocladus abbreviatus]
MLVARFKRDLLAEETRFSCRRKQYRQGFDSSDGVVDDVPEIVADEFEELFEDRHGFLLFLSSHFSGIKREKRMEGPFPVSLVSGRFRVPGCSVELLARDIDPDKVAKLLN